MVAMMQTKILEQRDKAATAERRVVELERALEASQARPDRGGDGRGDRGGDRGGDGRGLAQAGPAAALTLAGRVEALEWQGPRPFLDPSGPFGGGRDSLLHEAAAQVAGG